MQYSLTPRRDRCTINTEKRVCRRAVAVALISAISSVACSAWAVVAVGSPRGQRKQSPFSILSRQP